ncbi:MAG: hypothetical protein ACREDJ_06720, partial [Methylocella sp.]
PKLSAGPFPAAQRQGLPLGSNGLAKIVTAGKTLHESIEHAGPYTLGWIGSQESIKIHKRLMQLKPVTRVKY